MIDKYKLKVKTTDYELIDRALDKLEIEHITYRNDDYWRMLVWNKRKKKYNILRFTKDQEYIDEA